MNTRPPATDPLDPAEREFARILHALPAGEPSPALDARILGAARDAVAQPRPRRRGLLWAGTSSGAAWGIGSAAAAILALGIVWRVNAPVEESVPAAPRVVRTAAPADDQEATTVDYIQDADRVAETAAPAPLPQAKPQPFEERKERLARNVGALASAPPPPAPAAAAAPAPFPAEVMHEEQARREQASEDELDALVVTGSAVAGKRDAAAAPPQAPPASAPATGGAYSRGTDRVDGLYARQKAAANAERAASDARADAAPDPEPAMAAEAAPAPGIASSAAVVEAPEVSRERVRPDAQLAPEAWLQRIRTRVRGGDVHGARASLRLYVERHPQRAVPEDLRYLLRQ